MYKKVYFDKNGEQIMNGMTIVHEDGEVELVYVCGDDNEDLGVNASNEVWLENHYGSSKEFFREYYPLSQFNLKEWQIKKDLE